MAPSPRRRFGLDPAQLLQLAGVAAAIVLAVIVNVLAARHYKRWDVTAGKRYTLSPATLETLHSLDGKIEIWIMLGSGDRLEQSVKQLVASYRAESSLIDVHLIDPDRDAVALIDVQQRFKIEAGRGEDGRVTTDAVVVVARGDKHWFLTASDMFEAMPGDDVRAKPHEEQALTGAIRSVLGGEKTRLCFASGHGELGFEPSRSGWIGDLRSILEKDNYELTAVDTTRPDAHEPFAGCRAVIVAGPLAPWTKEEEARLKTYLLQGGNMLLAASPIAGSAEAELASLGLEDALAPFGIALASDLVIDPEPSVMLPGTDGIEFFVTAKPHAIAEALAKSEIVRDPPRIVVSTAQSLRRVAPEGAAAADDVLVTSPRSYTKRSFKGASKGAGALERQDGDPSGPFVIAMASERPKVEKSATHGPRVVVIGSRYMLVEETFRHPKPLRGAAFLVESSISWLTSRQKVLDVPDKPAVAAGIKISEESRADVRNYVLVYMPLAALLAGVGIAFARRSTEGAPRAKPRKKKKGPKKKALDKEEPS